MTMQASLATIDGNHAVSVPPQTRKLIKVTVSAVIAAACVLTVAGKFDSTDCVAVSAIACLAGFLGALTPRVLLTSFFVSAPLLWALGDTSVLQGDRVHVNLPMLVGFVLIVAFGHFLLVRDPDPGVEVIRKLVLAMGCVCIPAVFSAHDFFTGAGVYLRIMCPYIVMFATLRNIRDKTDVLHYARSMSFALLAVAVVLMIAYSRSQLWVDFGGYTRLGALYYQTQGFGMYLSVMLFVVMLNYLLTRKKVYLLLLSFPLLALFLTYVRTAWVGGIVLLLLLAFQIKKSYGRRLLLVGLVLSALFFSSVWQGILRYDTAVDSPALVDKILQGRLGVALVAIETYLEAPLYNKIFGIGLYRARETEQLVYGEEFMIHDDYLAWLVEVGVFALPLYLAMLIALLKRSRQGKRNARERIAYDVCGAASVLIIVVMIIGIPGAFYSEVLSNSYIYGTMGLMLSQSSLHPSYGNREEAERLW